MHGEEGSLNDPLAVGNFVDDADGEVVASAAGVVGGARVVAVGTYLKNFALVVDPSAVAALCWAWAHLGYLRAHPGNLDLEVDFLGDSYLIRGMAVEREAGLTLAAAGPFLGSVAMEVVVCLAFACPSPFAAALAQVEIY